MAFDAKRTSWQNRTWRITSIMQYKFTVSTRSGKYHLNADAFSWIQKTRKYTYVVFQIKGGMLDEHHKLLTKYIKGERVDSVDKKLKQKLRRWKKKSYIRQK